MGLCFGFVCFRNGDVVFDVLAFILFHLCSQGSSAFEVENGSQVLLSLSVETLLSRGE